MDESHHTLLTLGVAMMAGVLCQSIARHIRFPAIVLLLGVGAALGPEGLAWVHPRSLGAGLFGLVEIGIAIILFEGGLNLQASRLKRQERPIRYLISVGAVTTLIGAGAAAHFILGWSWQLSFLFGSLVVVTGPTVVTPLVRDMRLNPHLKTILEAEGVLIDPIGAILASLALQIVLAPSVSDTLLPVTTRVVSCLGFGVLSGLVGGLLLGGVLKIRHVIPHGFENIFALAFVILLFTASEAVFPTAGIMAVTVAGVVVGWIGHETERELREFKDQLTVLLIGILFVLLAADIRLADVRSLGQSGVWVMAALVFAVRPACVWLSTHNSKVTLKEKIFLSWVAPRGIVAAAIASLTADAVTQNNLAGAEQLRGLVFLTIATTVVLAGLTVRPVASLLGLRLPGRNRVAILSADGLGIVLGDELKRSQVPVVFLDFDPKRCEQAQKKGHAVVFGDALEERTLARAQFDSVGIAVGLSSNDHLNSLFVAHAREYFGVPKGLVALETLSSAGLPAYIRKLGGDVLFDGPHDTERWDVRYRHNQIRVARLVFQMDQDNFEPEPAPTDARPDAPRKISERYVILAVKRGAKMSPMSASVRFKKGDIASVAVYEPEFETALNELRARGWIPAPEEPTAPPPAQPDAVPRAPARST